ncbi:MAG: hypothetical protein FJX44_01180 [Alphaproteobacteria bacterium]|nr:hypothetical protein [Alphaproteobacteria bacterium]
MAVLAAVLLTVLALTGLKAKAQEESPALWSAETPCENYRHPYEADLCQQWRQAQAAEETALADKQTATATQRAARHAWLQTLIAAAVATLLSLIGLALLAGAYVIWRAARAFEQARRQELRAYVDVDKLEFVEAPETEGIVKIKLVFKNSGQTPAFDQRSAAEVKVHEPEDGAEVPIMPLPDRAANSGTQRLGRDAISASIVECKATRNIADRVSKGNAVILVWGWTEYVDIFDQERKTAFHYVCDAETLKSGLIFKPVQRSDEIT